MAKLYVVATPIGNLGDFSRRGIEVLNEADLIAAEDTRRTVKLLNHCSIKKPLVSYHKFNERERAAELVGRIRAENLTVALVSDAGTPCVSDPGHILVNLARMEGIAVVAVPGPSAVAAALSISGFEIECFAFRGFLPKAKNRRCEFLENIARSPVRTWVLYESPKRIHRLMEELNDMPPGTLVCICCDITKLHEQTVRGTAAEAARILKADPKAELGEYTIVLQKPEQPAYACGRTETSMADELSHEALLFDILLKTRCSMKDAVRDLCRRYPERDRKEVYSASLDLKKRLLAANDT